VIRLNLISPLTNPNTIYPLMITSKNTAIKEEKPHSGKLGPSKKEHWDSGSDTLC